MDFDSTNRTGGHTGVTPSMASGSVMPEQMPSAIPQMPVSSGADDIVLTTSDEKKSRKGLKITLAIVISVILLITAGCAIYFSIFNPAEVFKEKISTYSQRYEKLTSIYSAIANTEDGSVNWAEIADDYVANEAQYKTIVELGSEITDINPTILDNVLVSEAKATITKTSQIFTKVTDNLSFLSSLYDGYIAYYLPYFEDENYSDSLPVLENTVTSPKDENIDLFNEALRNFADFMELYSTNVKTLKYKKLGCEKEVNIVGCDTLDRSFANNRAALVAEWEQFESLIFEQLLELDEFLATDIYGVSSLKTIESRLNE